MEALPPALRYQEEPGNEYNHLGLLYQIRCTAAYQSSGYPHPISAGKIALLLMGKKSVSEKPITLPNTQLKFNSQNTTCKGEMNLRSVVLIFELALLLPPNLSKLPNIKHPLSFPQIKRIFGKCSKLFCWKQWLMKAISEFSAITFCSKNWVGGF